MKLDLLHFKLIKTTKRLTFDILWQEPLTINSIIDSKLFKFTASNGYEVISRSRMDIQTERLWLLGTSPDDSRSGSMVFTDNTKRDKAYYEFLKALKEWNNFYSK